MLDGWCVVDVWESEQAFARFRDSQLGPAFGKMKLPQPQVTSFEVFHRHPSKRYPSG